MGIIFFSLFFSTATTMLIIRRSSCWVAAVVEDVLVDVVGVDAFADAVCFRFSLD